MIHPSRRWATPSPVHQFRVRTGETQKPTMRRDAPFHFLLTVLLPLCTPGMRCACCTNERCNRYGVCGCNSSSTYRTTPSASTSSSFLHRRLPQQIQRFTHHQPPPYRYRNGRGPSRHVLRKSALCFNHSYIRLGSGRSCHSEKVCPEVSIVTHLSRRSQDFDCDMADMAENPTDGGCIMIPPYVPLICVLLAGLT